MNQTVWISMGSNMGDRRVNFEHALSELALEFTIDKISSVYETEPVGPVQQESFYNMIFSLITSQTPSEVMEKLLNVEAALGRKRTTKWGPRIIDLDIIFFDDLVINRDHLIIPHPTYTERRFVLEPLYEVTPDFKCPRFAKTIRQLLDECPDHHKVKNVHAPIQNFRMIHS